MVKLALVTPTMGRQHLHPQLHQTFRDQTVTQKGYGRLSFLMRARSRRRTSRSCSDSAVTYVHRDPKPRIDGVTRIGETRNDLNAKVREEYCQHLDDDDPAASTFCEFMLMSRRRGPGKIGIFRLLHQASQLIFECRHHEGGGAHWALMGDQIKKMAVGDGEMPSDLVAYMKRWWGFSLAIRRGCGLEHPLPRRGDRGHRLCRERERGGGKVVYITDGADQIMHIVGSGESQRAFARNYSGAASGSASEEIASAMRGMTPLPDGEPIQIAPDVRFGVLASLDTKYSLRNIGIRAKDGGLVIESIRDNVDPGEFGVAAPPAGMRLLLAVGHGTKVKTLPWKAPGFLAAFEKSHVVKAWSSTPVGAGFAAPTEPWDAGRMPLQGYAAAIFGAGKHSTTLGPRGEPLGAAGCRSRVRNAPRSDTARQEAADIGARRERDGHSRSSCRGRRGGTRATVSSGVAGMSETTEPVTTPMGREEHPRLARERWVDH